MAVLTYVEGRDLKKIDSLALSSKKKLFKPDFDAFTFQRFFLFKTLTFKGGIQRLSVWKLE